MIALNFFWIATFGVVGVFSRYGLDRWGAGLNWPYSTFAINLVGSFLIGLVAAQPDFAQNELKVAITVGLLGGFTTFSAFSLQVVQLLQNQQTIAALLYATASPVLGIAAAWLGLRLGA